ncbi:hypothetical protein L208DRAFT_1411830 [Tricholoma matsutake]|nr:hypothetical protein L208DRAFT_1411830 [Tricholoma matsutake 945]
MGVGWLAQAIAQGAIGGAIGLQRICIAWGCPDFPFKRLRKLALTTIDFRNSKMVTALLELWSLTHLAVDRFFNVEQPTLREIGSMFQDVDWSDLLMQNLRNHRAALIRKFDSMEPLSRVLLVPYDLEVEGSDWFPNKILDGTLWHME